MEYRLSQSAANGRFWASGADGKLVSNNANLEYVPSGRIKLDVRIINEHLIIHLTAAIRDGIICPTSLKPLSLAVRYYLNPMHLTPKDQIEIGADILSECLVPLGFKFKVLLTGKGSDGHFAQGHFLSGDRIIEFSFRNSLGHVSYKVGLAELSHEDYIDLLSKHDQNKYPNFSDDKLESFRCLLSDLKLLLTDFTENDAFLFRQNIPAILKQKDQRDLIYNRQACGDLQLLEDANIEFKKGNYAQVCRIREK